MTLSRRQFGAAALGGILAPLAVPPAFAEAARPLTAAIEAIRDYGARHLVHYRLPGMTLGLTAPGGFSTVLNFGFANREPATAIGSDTLFQVGSITKVMTAAVVHQLAAEGRFRLDGRISDLLPRLALPAGNGITVQDLLDHVSGLPSDAPLAPPGGLWTGFPAGAHWHYSNTGYEILGKLAEHVSGEPLARLFEARIFNAAGMTRSRGAIIAADKPLYAQGYEAADRSVPFAFGVPLAPAAWVDVTSGALCVASTAADMMRFLRMLSGVAAGRGGLGLSPAQGSEFGRHAVPSDTRGMTYGNGLMHVDYAGRSYLHHTGGMVSFSSSFHLDEASGAAAFACANLSAFAEFRPRLLTLFAAEALAAAAAGRPIPAPPSLAVPLVDAASYVGGYSGPHGAFEVFAGAPLTITANGRSAALQPWGGELFRTTHPDFRAFTLMFERLGPAIVGASWGATSYARAGQSFVVPPSDPALARLAGKYVNDSPWWGTLSAVERGGALWLGTETPTSRIADNLWRVGSQPWSPERVDFAGLAGGRPRTLIFSGERFDRSDG